MLLKEARYKKYPSSNSDKFGYTPTSSNFCMRSGVKGFLSKDNYESLCNLYGPKTLSLISEDLVKKIDVRPSPCIRIFYGHLTGFKIPQLVMYAPEMGFPLCLPEKTPVFIRGSKWPSKANRCFTTIPVAHILKGLTSDDRRVCHNYSVFFGNEEERFYPAALDPRLEFPEYRVSYGKGYSFITDVNSVKILSKVATESWPEFDLGKLFSGVAIPSEIEAMVSDTGYGKLLNEEEFNTYLAYWAWMYPHKYRRARGDTAGSAGSLEKNQGYLPYSFDNKSDLLGGGSNLFKLYYGLTKGISYRSLSYSTKSLESMYAFFKNPDDHIKTQMHQKFNCLPEEFIRECFRIRSMLETLNKKSKRKNVFCFKKFGRRDSPYTHFTDADIKLFASIMDSRKKLEIGSKPVIYGDNCCPKCEGDLIIPKLLAEAAPKIGSLICIDCGYKYMTNLLNYCLGRNWLFFEEYPLSEVLGTLNLREFASSLSKLYVGVE